jgi:hypothetical protein
MRWALGDGVVGAAMGERVSGVWGWGIKSRSEE